MRVEYGAVCLIFGLACAFAYFFFSIDAAAFLAATGVCIALCLLCCEERGLSLPLLGIVALAVILRSNLADFSLVVGDASAYTWDAVRAVETAEGGLGHFPPLTAALASVTYTFVGLESVAVFNVMFAAIAALVAAYFVQTATGNRTASAFVGLAFAVQPLAVWFGKTTFSEPSWQVIVLFVVTIVATLSRKAMVLQIALLASLVFISNFSRGSAPFLVLPAIACVAVHPALTHKQRVCTSVALVAAFAAGLALMLQIRPVYLIDWQYSRVAEGIRRREVLALMAGAAAVGAGSLIYATRLLGHQLSTRALLMGFLFVKFIVALVFEGSTLDLLIGNEYSFAYENFGAAGVLLSSIGFLVTLVHGWKGRPWALIITGVYCFSSAPFALQNVSAEMAHELHLYWSRYFYSEIWAIYLVLWGVAFAWLVEKTRLTQPHVVIALSLLLFASLVNWPLLNRVVARSYLEHSASMYQFLNAVAAEDQVAVLASNRPMYGSYSPAFMLQRAGQLNANIVVEEAPPIVDRDTEGRVICVNVDCSSMRNHKLSGSMTFPLVWYWQDHSYSKGLKKSRILRLEVYDDREQ